MKTYRYPIVFAAALLLAATGLRAQERSVERLSEGWRFAFGNASDPAGDFGCGTEYFNYLTKANSLHNEGPYSLKFDDSSWQEVRIPHDFVAALGYDSAASHSHGYKTVGWKYPETSVGWYRRELAIGAEELGKHLQLRFDGIFRNAQVWFNGFYMGTEPSGYASQVYDITDYVNYGGVNLICVRADATLEEGWFYEGGGIYRDVWLEKTGAQHVAPFGTFVHAELSAPYEEALIHVETEVQNRSLRAADCMVSHVLTDAEGREVAVSGAETLSLQPMQTGLSRLCMKLSAPRLWDTADPYLYKVTTTVSAEGEVTDCYETTIGIRDVEFTADGGFFLNGKALKIKGVNCHQDHAGVGAAIPDALQAWRIRQLKDLGCNAYRASHNPMTPALLDICDREGILVIDENRLAGVNEEHLRLLERMIKRDRNHPCIILWSDGNEEWGLENSETGRRVAATMREHTRLLDPTRHSTMANAGGSELIKGLDVVGYNYIVQNDVEERRRQHPDWKVTGTEETTGCGTRGVYFNSTEDPGHMKALNLSAADGRSENVIERGWKFYAEHPWASGMFFWTGFDYRGEPNPLAYPATVSEFGILDYCGFPKDEAFYLKAWWTGEPVLHVFPHWNLAGHEGEQVDVWAYSNCDEVELFVNGRSLGRRSMPENGHLKWTAAYRPGTLRAVGYKNGRRILTEKIETTGEACTAALTADRSTIAADGRDVCVVTISMTDAKGRFVPDACNALDLSLSGDARIIGVGNGDPAWLGAENPGALDCREFGVKAFNGLAQVLIQSGTTPGPVTLTCSGSGLAASTLEISAASPATAGACSPRRF